MDSRKAVFLNIVISIIFAVSIVVSNYLLDGTPYDQTVLYILIALWWIPFMLLSMAGVKEQNNP